MAEKTHRLFSRREVEGMIADGRKIFILDQFVIKADPWLPYHPGGDGAIQHMVGRDATDEVTALHSPETKQLMLKRYRIGRIEGRWRNFIPPIQGGRFRALDDAAEAEYEPEPVSPQASSSATPSPESSPVFDALRNRNGNAGPGSETSSVSSISFAKEDDGMSHLDVVTREKVVLDLDRYPDLDDETQDAIKDKYRALHERIKAEGLYQCNYWAYGVEVLRYSMLCAGTMLCLRWGWYALGGILLAALWHQLVFTAHDAGHIGITHNYHVDTCIGILIADFIGGLSIGWWKRNHNTHHIVTNSPEHDPDIEHMPFLAVSHRFLESLRSTYYGHVMTYDAVAKVMLRVQKYTYYPLMALGRFNLYRHSWVYLLGSQAPRRGPAWWHRYLELAGHAFFWFWYGYLVLYRSIPTGWDRFVFFMLSHTLVAPLHVQITLSHFAMSTAELGPHESFPQKMLRTTMDVDCPPWLDFFHGGLQFQAVHHLYPRIPRHNLRRTRRLVQEFCDDVGIPYALYGFADCNKRVVGTLGEVSRQAAILAKCQQAMATGEHAHSH